MVNLLTRSEWDDLDDSHEVRERFETYEEYQRYCVMRSAEATAGVAREYRTVATAGFSIAAAYLLARGVDDLLGGI